jgi:hypothetical protein
MEDEWCWAATISNLFAYHGHPVSQAEIVSTVYGAPGDWASGQYSNMAALLNRQWFDDNGQPFTAQLTGVFDVNAGIDTLTNDDIASALQSNNPLVMATTQHAMLVIGLQYCGSGTQVQSVENVGVFDPWPGEGLRDLTQTEATPAPNGGSLMFVAEATISP